MKSDKTVEEEIRRFGIPIATSLENSLLASLGALKYLSEIYFKCGMEREELQKVILVYVRELIEEKSRTEESYRQTRKALEILSQERFDFSSRR